MKQLFSEIRPALLATIILVVVCCGIYPLAVYGIAQIAFRDKANGSLLVQKEGRIRGTKLIG